MGNFFGASRGLGIILQKKSQINKYVDRKALLYTASRYHTLHDIDIMTL